jgi:hypothetical protein
MPRIVRTFEMHNMTFGSKTALDSSKPEWWAVHTASIIIMLRVRHVPLLWRSFSSMTDMSQNTVEDVIRSKVCVFSIRDKSRSKQ